MVSGIHKPDGIVGDLGGGSLELIDVRGNRVRSGVTLPLGSLALQDLSHKSLKRAERIVKTELSGVAQLKAGRGRTFYAVGGTWRALARIHIIQSEYPLRVMHGYSIPAPDALDFAQRLRRLVAANMLANIEVVADARRPLLAYAALVLEYIIRVAKPKTIVFSTFGVREGLLYEMLPQAERARDGLICAAQTLNELLSRSARHAQELIGWTDRLVRVVKLRETDEDRRLRHAACLLSDIGWRVHPDHRGEETLSLITNGNFGSISHQGRAFVALSVFYRYAGLSEENEPPALIQRTGAAGHGRARARARRGISRRPSDLGGAAGRVAGNPFSQPRPQADAGVRTPDGRSGRRPRRQPLQAAGAAGRPLRVDRAAVGRAYSSPRLAAGSRRAKLALGVARNAGWGLLSKLSGQRQVSSRSAAACLFPAADLDLVFICSYNNSMKITFDPAKRASTLRDRSLDFADAAEVFAGTP